MKRNVIAVMLTAAMIAVSPLSVFAAETESHTEVSEALDVENQDMDDVSEENETTDVQENVITEQADKLKGANDSIPNVSYQVHVQSYGWQGYKESGETAGTIGEAKRLEAVQISLGDSNYSGEIQYRTHVQSYGWQEWVSNGEISGTSGEAKRLEAIQIRLTGDLEKNFDVYYRVHAQSYGWLDWAANGEKAGTSTFGKRLEGLEVVLVKKGDSAPGNTEQPYVSRVVEYQTHVQSYGWQEKGYDGELSGTSGEGKRLEGIKISMCDGLEYPGSIEYKTHVQTYGWQEWVSDGEVSGTSGEAKRLEAIQIRLTGDVANDYSVYYRVHCQTYGWLGWAKDGESSGTEGMGKRLEAIEIMVVSKDAPDAPNVSADAYIKAEEKPVEVVTPVEDKKPSIDNDNTDKNPGSETGSNAGNTGSGTISGTVTTSKLVNPCPRAYYVSSEFGGRATPTAGATSNHKGRDYAAAAGTDIHAAANGKVIFVGYKDGSVGYNSARGNYVIIEHENGLKTLYQHCSKILVTEGQEVTVGTVIAKVGQTGVATGDHLHFEVWVNEIPVDPRLYL